MHAVSEVRLKLQWGLVVRDALRQQGKRPQDRRLVTQMKVEMRGRSHLELHGSPGQCLRGYAQHHIGLRARHFDVYVRFARLHEYEAAVARKDELRARQRRRQYIAQGFFLSGSGPTLVSEDRLTPVCRGSAKVPGYRALTARLSEQMRALALK